MSRLKRLGRPLGVAVAIVAIVAGTFALVWSYVVPGVAARATNLDEVDLTLGAAAVNRAAINQALVFAVDNNTGTASNAAVATALAEAEANLAAYDELLAALDAGGVDVNEEVLGALAIQGRAVLDSLRAGDISTGRALTEGTFEQTYGAVIAELGDARGDLLSGIEASTRWSDSLAPATRLAVTLVLPLLAIAVFWWMAKKRIAVNRVRAEELVAIEADRVREKDALIAEVANRLSAPLANIQGLTDVLAKKKDIKGLDRELVALVNSQSGDLYRVAEDITFAAQLEARAVTASADIVALGPVIDEAVKPLRAAGVDIKVECPEVWVVTDGEKVGHILRNLLANAAHHGEPPIFIEVSEVEGVVQCLVIDHGPGLPPGHWADTWEPRTIEDGFTEATGLGLKVAYSLARLVGAQLEHYRVDDQTRFSLSFSEDDPETLRRRGRKGIIRRIPRPIRPPVVQEAE